MRNLSSWVARWTGIHLHLNPLHAEVAEEYLEDLRAAVEQAREGAGPEMAAIRAY